MLVSISKLCMMFLENSSNELKYWIVLIQPTRYDVVSVVQINNSLKRPIVQTVVVQTNGNVTTSVWQHSPY